MIAVAVAAALFGQGEATAMPAILPLLIGAVIVSELMSAYVLFAEFARSRLLWLLFISAAYCSTAVLTIPYILTFPAVFAPSGFLAASGQTALHLWILWHLGFPTFVLGAIFIGRLPQDVRVEAASAPRLVASTIAACVVFGCAAPFLSEAWGRYLPDLVVGRTFTPATTAAVLPLILFLDILALVMLYARTRNQTVISLWLFVALVASALDAFIGVLCSRYSYGWYVGKIFLVLSSGVLLGAFIGETGRLRTRLGRAHDDLNRTREREHHLAQERLHRVAYYDDLTGLSNRNHLEERLRALAATPQCRFAVLFLSIDTFKEVNDQFGHAAADRVLTDVASRLIDGVRRDDTVARFSGDEFVVLAPSIPTADDAEVLAKALREAILAPFDVPDGTVKITASVGIAMFPDDGASAEAVLDNADAAARQAQRTGGNTTLCYSREFFEDARARRRLQEDLSLALLTNSSFYTSRFSICEPARWRRSRPSSAGCIPSAASSHRLPSFRSPSKPASCSSSATGSWRRRYGRRRRGWRPARRPVSQSMSRRGNSTTAASSIICSAYSRQRTFRQICSTSRSRNRRR
jgi:diguanylate cyclase (GGDEF)-like protein